MFNRQIYFLIIFVHIIVLVRLIKVISNLVCGSINERSMIISFEKNDNTWKNPPIR